MASLKQIWIQNGGLSKAVFNGIATIAYRCVQPFTAFFPPSQPTYVFVSDELMPRAQNSDWWRFRFRGHFRLQCERGPWALKMRPLQTTLQPTWLDDRKSPATADGHWCFQEAGIPMGGIHVMQETVILICSFAVIFSPWNRLFQSWPVTMII